MSNKLIQQALALRQLQIGGASPAPSSARKNKARIPATEAAEAGKVAKVATTATTAEALEAAREALRQERIDRLNFPSAYLEDGAVSDEEKDTSEFLNGLRTERLATRKRSRHVIQKRRAKQGKTGGGGSSQALAKLAFTVPGVNLDKLLTRVTAPREAVPVKRKRGSGRYGRADSAPAAGAAAPSK
ncbi:hypothetical protein H696_04697 [Fonticula alba]|uniref:Uncharacterized protein n=1 Tax=Fonticula alba TaxID=691883 RepID=A0A058Z4G0_FONAL|nr:hypothetical protein H696_04697 [Fonticula alba]KCV68402.1 hypothetical protein H696_04697 [Fonticula alba]|eukprot:XP_009496834.1 hypothetical protein H696_04697 [Fonticula alba]